MKRHVLVLIENNAYPTQIRARHQAKALVAAGYDVTVAGPTGFGYEAADETLDGVRVVRHPSVPTGVRPLDYVREYAVSMARLGRLIRKVRKERRVDAVLVSNSPNSLILLALPLKARGAGIVLDYHDPGPELYEAKFHRRDVFHRLLVSLDRLAFRIADVVITVNEACAELVRTRGRVPPKNILIVGNGPDPRRLFPVDPDPGLRRRKHLVLWLGVMSRQERLDLLIDAADQLVNAKGRTDVSFAIVGFGDARQAVLEEVERRGLGGVVDLPGAVLDGDRLRAYIATADVCVGVDDRNPLNDRASMMKVFEYMAMGRPVVQFPLPEMQKVCGDASVYARNADPLDLAEQIGRLLDDPERRARLGAEARRRVAPHMWPEQIPSLLAAVESALDSRGRSNAAAAT